MVAPDTQQSRRMTFFAPAGRAAPEALRASLAAVSNPIVSVVLEAAQGYVLILNEQRQLLAANDELLAALKCTSVNDYVGLRPGEILGCIHAVEGPDGCGTSLHCRNCGAVIALLASWNKPGPAVGECSLVMKNTGQLRVVDFEVKATRVQLADHALTVLVLQDITRVKQHDLMDKVFLHDVLNTLCGLEELGDLLAIQSPEEVSAQILHLANYLKSEVQFQQAFAQAEAGELSLKKEQISIKTVLSRLNGLLHGFSRIGHCRIMIEAAAEDAVIETDEALLQRVLLNMVKNAAEASAPEDLVKVAAEISPDAVTFKVCNRGVIEPGIAAHIFEKTSSTKGSGRGVGTYSMKLFGEKYLGGEVSFVSDSDNGTIFSFVLPAVQQKPARVDKTRAGSAAANGIRVLFVDDLEPVANVAGLMLKHSGIEATLCTEPREALRIFRAQQEDFSVVITDSRMPQMTGIELAKELQAIRPGLPVIMCSGFGEEISAEEMAKAGIVATLQKPFRQEELTEAVAQAVKR